MVKWTAKKRKAAPGKILKSKEKNRSIISLVASVLIGLTLLVSGTGKIVGAEGVPAQIVDFISNIIPDIFITPATLSFLYNILIPHVFPWAEFILGACLLIGFLPRLMAVLTIPLLLSFLGTNLWAIIHGGYTTCASCFGIWENYLGSLTPAQSLVYDLVLIAFAIVVITFHPGGFLSSRKWLENLGKGKKKLDTATIKLTIYELGSRLRDFGSKALIYLKAIGGKARQHPYIALVAGTCVLGLVAYGIVAASSRPAAHVVSDIHVTVSETSAVISWATDKPAINSVEIYKEDRSLITTVTDENPVTVHLIPVDGLLPDSTYFFEILSADKQALSKVSSFKTLVIKPFTISDIRASYINESSATITWVTSRPATGEVKYWVQASQGQQTASSSELVTQHSINLTSLETNAIYHYQVKSVDTSGTQAISPQFTMSAQIGRPAPDFTLNSLDGKTISLSDYQGKLIMLDFWMWSCTACREKMAIIQEAYAKIPPEKTAILPIHFMGRESAIRSYAEGEKLTVPILLDPDGTVTDLYNVNVFPTVLFIDGDGIIRLMDPRFSNAEELENIFNNLPEDK
ncbi:MAG: redoxin domain-containing protein [Dehalococcoidia bacterium]|nr:redoxin domain-containing protein [Dehalococcoidia bacterium]